MTPSSSAAAAAPPNAPAPLLCLAGPTAAGKSAAALAIAQHWPIEIVNVDSATIYRGMDIGTAKPSAAERAQVVQHLLDIRDPAQSYSAAEFRADALTLIAQIRARGHMPLLTGGTMLYYKALRDGLDALPGADPAVRADIDARAAAQGWPALHAELARLDPASAARLAPHDSQRIQRALEICLVSGQPMSALLGQRAKQPDPANAATSLHLISLEPSNRLALHSRITQRFDAMLAAGLEDEVRALRTRTDLHPGLPAVRCVGYRQLWSWLDGDVARATAREQAIAATRQLAKRQLTWLRSWPERAVVDCLAPHAVAEVLAHAASVLDRSPA